MWLNSESKGLKTLLDQIKSVSEPNNYSVKKVETRKEQGFYAFFMHTELTQQEGLSICLSVSTYRHDLTSTVLKTSIILIIRFSKRIADY